MKKNILIKITDLFLFCFFFMLFTACTNTIQNENPLNPVMDETEKQEVLVTVRGNLKSDKNGAFPQEFVSRTALPSVSTSNLTYTITAVQGEGTVKGTVNPSDLSYKFTLLPGTYTITANAFSDEECTKKVLDGSTEIIVNEDKTITGNLSINMTLISDDTVGKGTVKLPVKIYKNSGITKLTANWMYNGTESEVTVDFDDSTEDVCSKYFTMNDSVNCGTYHVKFIFTKANNEIAYSFLETINVFSNMETNMWLKNDSAVYLYTEGINTLVCITKLLVDSFAFTSYYVSSAGDDSNIGDFFFPLKTVQKASDYIVSKNDGTTEYSIILLDDCEPSADYSFVQDPATNKGYAFLAINPSKPLKLVIEGYNAQKFKINANGSTTNARVAYIGADADVTFKHVILDAGKTNYSGGGVYVDSSAHVTFDGVTVSNCSSSTGGGGVYVAKDGELLIKNTEFENNSLGLSSSKGITVYNDAGTVKLSDSVNGIQNIYLAYVSGVQSQLTVDDNLGTTESSIPLELGNYSENQILTGTSSAIQDKHSLFTVISGGAYRYSIDDTGKLCAQSVVSQPIGDLTSAPTDSSVVYSLSSKEDLKTFASWVKAGNTFENFNFKIQEDSGEINFTGLWTPLGSEEKPFMGTFDGSNVYLSGFTISGGVCSGLFACTKNATIKNIKIKSIGILPNGDYFGVIVGKVIGDTVIENCDVDVPFSASTGNYFGGIVGGKTDSEGKLIIRNCVNRSAVKQKYNYSSVGGIIGGTNGTEDNLVEIYNCANYGEIKGGKNLGGIVGEAKYTLIENCLSYPTNSITASETDCIGNIVGYGDENTVLKNCYYNVGFTEISTTSPVYAGKIENADNIKNCNVFTVVEDLKDNSKHIFSSDVVKRSDLRITMNEWVESKNQEENGLYKPWIYTAEDKLVCDYD